MSKLTEEVVFRLLLAKSLLNSTSKFATAEPDNFLVAQSLLSAHDAAELVIAAVASYCGAVSKDTYLMPYIAAVETKTGRSVEGKTYMGQLNQTRNGLKHQGILPNAQQWRRVVEKTYETASKWCSDFLELSLDDLDQSALLRLDEVRQFYAAAKEHSLREEYELALVTLGKALHVVFRENPALRGMRVGVARSEDAIKLAGFGVHGNDYLALQEFLPPIQENRATKEMKHYWGQIPFGHPANWRWDSVEFCLRVFLDIALKIQNAVWIPGAIAFEHVYRYRITALETASIWKDRPAENEPLPDVLHSLQKGESIFVSDVKTLRSSNSNLSRLAAALSGSLTDPFDLSPPKTYGEHLELDGVFDWHTRGFVATELVAVTCAPKSNEFVSEYFPNLDEVGWQPKYK